MRRNVCHVAIQQVFNVSLSRRRFPGGDSSATFGLDPIVRPWPKGAPATLAAKAFYNPNSCSTASVAVRHF